MYFSFSPISTPSSYNSYSTSPMSIPSSSTSEPSCAYPSWPRRSSLNGDEDAQTSTSFIISDEELFPCVFDDEPSPPATPTSRLSRSPSSPSNLCDMVVTRGSLMRELVAEEKAKKGKKEGRRAKSAGRKSRTSSASGKHMSPIQEVGQ